MVYDNSPAYGFRNYQDPFLRPRGFKFKLRSASHWRMTKGIHVGFRPEYPQIVHCIPARTSDHPHASHALDRGALRVKVVDLAHGTKDVLAIVLGPGYWSRFRSAVMVGTGCYHSNLCLELVGGLSQRLVLRRRAAIAPTGGFHERAAPVNENSRSFLLPARIGGCRPTGGTGKLYFSLLQLRRAVCLSFG